MAVDLIRSDQLGKNPTDTNGEGVAQKVLSRDGQLATSITKTQWLRDEGHCLEKKYEQQGSVHGGKDSLGGLFSANLPLQQTCGRLVVT